LERLYLRSLEKRTIVLEKTLGAVSQLTEWQMLVLAFVCIGKEKRNNLLFYEPKQIPMHCESGPDLHRSS